MSRQYRIETLAKSVHVGALMNGKVAVTLNNNDCLCWAARAWTCDQFHRAVTRAAGCKTKAQNVAKKDKISSQ
jgi:hypothetical protein